MANEEHIALLKQGVEIWNQWRETNYFIVPDLSGADLSRANLNQVNLNQANLCETDMRMASLSEADLTNADIRGSDLRGANLRGATLNSADLSGTDLSGAHLMLVNLIDANLASVNLSEANLRIANLTRANLSEANLKIANLSDANLSEVNFTLANLSEANLRMSNLSGANLTQIQALKTDFSKAILTGVCLEKFPTNSEINLTDVVCEYVYLQDGQSQRYPEQGSFASGEFIRLWRNGLNRVNSINPNPVTTVQNSQLATDALLSNLPSPDVEFSDSLPVRENPTLPTNWSGEIQTISETPPALANPMESDNWSKEINKIPNPPQSGGNFTISGNPSPVVNQIPVPPQMIQSHLYPVSLPKEITEVEKMLTQIERNLSKHKWVGVAEEIHKLLQDLTEIYPVNTPLEKVIVVAAAIKQMEGNPELKDTIMNAVQAAGSEILQELVDHPLSKIFLSALEE